MSGAQQADIVWYILALLLVLSALFQRRFSLGAAIRMLLSWVLIFGIAVILFSYRTEIGAILSHTRASLTGEPEQQISGSKLVIRKALDGHFWVNAEVNGTPVRFLIDSGASMTALSQDTADAAHVDVENDGLTAALMTANGPIAAQRAEVDKLEVGSIKVRHHQVVVSAAFGPMNVLGMNFLSQLTSWQVRGDQMILEP